MQAEDFVNCLNAIRVSVTDADRKEYSYAFLEEYENSFKVFPKENSAQHVNSVLKLISEYNCKNLAIGCITFNDVVIEDSLYYYFGKCEADRLAINKQTGEVEVREYGVNHTLFFCSKNADFFLDSLITAAEFISQIPIGEDIADDQSTACLIAIDCAKQAGGNKYSNFFKMLLGCER